MKKGKLFLCLVLVVLLGGMWIAPSVGEAQTIELTFNHLVPPKHLRNIHVFEPWAKMVEERTQGKVKIKHFFSNTLAPVQESFDAAASGVCDMTEAYTFGKPGRFLLTEFLALPEMGFPTAHSCAQALWHIYKTFPEVQAEYKGVKMFWLHTTPNMKVNTKKKRQHPGGPEGNEDRDFRANRREGGKHHLADAAALCTDRNAAKYRSIG